MSEWQPIETAPKDGSEILGYRADGGVFLVRWIAPVDFLTDPELQELDDEDAEEPDWFCADFVEGFRLDADEVPTHWMPLPLPPQDTAG